MYIIETKHHFINTNENVPPELVCVDLCKAVWWKNQLDDHNAVVNLQCPKCKGRLKKVSEKDYKVLEYKNIEVDQRKVNVSIMHNVKAEYEELAKRTWCK